MKQRKKSRTYITPTNKYWGFDKNPFSDFILTNETPDLFVNRNDEIADLEDALDNRLTGIYGNMGVGKSSLLRKFEKHISNETYPVFCKLTSLDEKSIFREILRSILNADILKSIKFSNNYILKSKSELDRLEGGYIESLNKEGGIDKLIVRKDTTGTAQEYIRHTEETALIVLSEIFMHTNDFLVIIIDDFDRIKYVLDNEGKSYLNFISKFISIINDTFSSDNISFVVTLDNRFNELIENERKEKNGEFAFSFEELVEVKSFDPNILAEMIKVRLSKTHIRLKGFISIGAF